MDLNMFLEGKEREKYLILLYIEERRSVFASVGQICEELGLSKFKVNQYLEELNTDLQVFSKNARIEVFKTGEIESLNINRLLVKKIRLKYLTNSNIYGLFESVFKKEVTAGEYANEHFIGRTNSYNYKKQLVKILKENNIMYKKDQLVGDELAIRNLIFSVYFEFFNGIASPFTEKEDKQINDFIQLVSTYFILFLPNTKKTKLYFYLGVWFQRIKNNHFLKNEAHGDFFAFKNTEAFIRLSQHIDHTYDELKDCWQFFFLYLYCEEILSGSDTNKKQVSFLFSRGEQNSIAKNIIESISFDDQVSLQEKEEYILKLSEEVNRINMKNNYFYTSLESFSSIQSFHYFEESYPKITRVISTNIKHYMEVNHINEEMMVRIYFDYMFSFLKIVPIRKIESTINICVDFSFGSSYSDYIISQVTEFHDLNVVIQSNVTIKTDIYLSDFALEGIKCRQIIWKNPPTSDDWEDFGNTVVQIKQERIEENESNY
jgi:hypothetical protein